MDWIFEGIAKWLQTCITSLLEAISSGFIEVFGMDLSLFQHYFPTVETAYEILQYTAWGLLFLIVVFQLFRAFGGPLTDVQEEPWQLIVKAALFGFLIGYALEIFNVILTFAKAPYTLLADINASDAAWSEVISSIESGVTGSDAAASLSGWRIVLFLILLIMLAINYFKLMLDIVERYVFLGFLAYTSPMAFALGASKSTNQPFKNWTRMVGTQMFLMMINVWVLKAVDSAFGTTIVGTDSDGDTVGGLLMWEFCIIAMIKIGMRMDTYLSALGLTTATTAQGIGSDITSFGRTMMMTMSNIVRSVSHGGGGGGSRTAGARDGGGTNPPGGGSTIGVGPSGAKAAVLSSSNGAGKGVGTSSTLSSNTIASVAAGRAGQSATIAGDPANKSLSNYMPGMKGYDLDGTTIEDGHISTTATDANGEQFDVEFNRANSGYTPTDQDELVTAADGTDWYRSVTPHADGSSADGAVDGGAGVEDLNGGMVLGTDGQTLDGQPGSFADGQTLNADGQPGVDGVSSMDVNGVGDLSDGQTLNADGQTIEGQPADGMVGNYADGQVDDLSGGQVLNADGMDSNGEVLNADGQFGADGATSVDAGDAGDLSDGQILNADGQAGNFSGGQVLNAEGVGPNGETLNTEGRPGVDGASGVDAGGAGNISDGQVLNADGQSADGSAGSFVAGQTIQADGSGDGATVLNGSQADGSGDIFTKPDSAQSSGDIFPTSDGSNLSGGVSATPSAGSGPSVGGGTTATSSFTASQISDVATAKSTGRVLSGEGADQSLSGYMPEMKGYDLSGTKIENGHISTTATNAEGQSAKVDFYSAAQHSEPQGAHGTFTAADGSTWYQTATHSGNSANVSGGGTMPTGGSSSFGGGSNIGSSGGTTPTGGSGAFSGGSNAGTSAPADSHVSGGSGDIYTAHGPAGGSGDIFPTSGGSNLSGGVSATPGAGSGPSEGGSNIGGSTPVGGSGAVGGSGNGYAGATSFAGGAAVGGTSGVAGGAAYHGSASGVGGGAGNFTASGTSGGTTPTGGSGPIGGGSGVGASSPAGGSGSFVGGGNMGNSSPIGGSVVSNGAAPTGGSGSFSGGNAAGASAPTGGSGMSGGVGTASNAGSGTSGGTIPTGGSGPIGGGSGVGASAPSGGSGSFVGGGNMGNSSPVGGSVVSNGAAPTGGSGSFSGGNAAGASAPTGGSGMSGGVGTASNAGSGTSGGTIPTGGSGPVGGGSSVGGGHTNVTPTATSTVYHNTVAPQQFSTIASGTNAATFSGQAAQQTLQGYMPNAAGTRKVTEMRVEKGTIQATMTGKDGRNINVQMFNAAQHGKPAGKYDTITASDGSKWYRTATRQKQQQKGRKDKKS